MSNQSIIRVQPGVPAGGQFVSTPKAESGVILPSAGADPDPMRGQFTGDNLAFYDTLDDDERRLFGVITYPDNDESGWGGAANRDGQATYLSEFGGYEGADPYDEVQQVFDRLRASYEHANSNESSAGGPSFGFSRDDDGGVSGFDIGVYLGADHDGTTLAAFHDERYLTTDRAATGLEAAVACAKSLDGEIRRVRRIARQAGLIPDTAPTGPYVPQHMPQVAAEKAEKAMRGWVDLPADGAPGQDTAKVRETAMRDALTDLRHWADANGVGMYAALGGSYRRYVDEKNHSEF